MSTLSLRVGLLLAFVMTSAARAGELRVSPAGLDANPGSKREPLRTIQAGVDRAGPGDTVVVGEGVYRETVSFPRSGESGRPITVSAEAGARVVVSGCDSIGDWTRHTDTVWEAPIPWTLGPGRNQVFAGDRVLVEARYPDEPSPGLEMYVSDLCPLWPTFGEFSIPNAAEQPGRITSPLLVGQPDDYWKGALYYGVHYEGWAAQTGVVESSKSGEITVGDRTDTWWFGSAYGGGYSPEEGRGMLVGHMNALNRPGEWVWQDGRLYLIPPDAKEPDGIEAKRRQLAFDLSGREHIRIVGIDVHAASMLLADSAFCSVERCALRYVSHFTRQYSIGQVERDRDTIRSGETGILVSGHDNAFRSCTVQYSAGAGFHLRGYHHTIFNCLIDEVDYTSHYLNAITDAVSDFGDYEGQLVGGHVIAYNTMRNAGRHLFNFHGNGTSLASRDRGPMDYMATLFAHNHLYNGMLETKDAGLMTGYYCSGGTLDGLNSQVVCNVIHDSYDIFAMRIGALGLIYLDAGTCNVDLRDNLLWAAPGSLQRGLWYNTMCVGIRESDNVFYPQFGRTCAELTAADFPNSRPFRFGHDSADPPPEPDWPPVVRAEVRLPTDARGEGLRDGDAIDLGEVDLEQGWQSVVAGFSSDVENSNADHSARQAPRHRKATDPLVLEAVTNDGAEQGIGTQWTFIRNVREGSWLRFAQVPLGEGYRRFRVIYGNAGDSASRLEVHLDAVDGPLVAEADLPPTDISRGGSVQVYRQAACEVSPEATGVRDVFLVFRAPGAGPVAEFEYFRFERYRGALPLQPDEVRLELRVGAPDGDIIGVLYPRPTGGTDRVAAFVASLEPTAGRQRLYLVVRSAVEGPIGRLRWVRLERADPGATPVGPGDPQVNDGRMVMPQATHLPRARPNDRYPHAVSTIRPRARLGGSLAELAAQGPPTDGLLVWLDAADGGALERDDRGSVALWRERSGSGRDATQPDPELRPTYLADGLNGRPAVLFDGDRETRLELPDLSADKLTATILAVFSNPAPPSEVNHDQRILTASDGEGFDYIVGIAATVPGLETGGPRLGAWVFADRWGRHVRIGCFSPNHQTYFTGSVSEVLVWTRALSELEQDRAIAYLVTKWDLRD